MTCGVAYTSKSALDLEVTFFASTNDSRDILNKVIKWHSTQNCKPISHWLTFIPPAIFIPFLISYFYICINTLSFKQEQMALNILYVTIFPEECFPPSFTVKKQYKVTQFPQMGAL